MRNRSTRRKGTRCMLFPPLRRAGGFRLAAHILAASCYQFPKQRPRNAVAGACSVARGCDARTTDSALRFLVLADHLRPDRRFDDRARGRRRLLWGCEDHGRGARERVTTLAEGPFDGPHPQRVLQAGGDFYAAPRLSPDGSRLAWLEWSLPNMPWFGCELWMGEGAAD